MPETGSNPEIPQLKPGPVMTWFEERAKSATMKVDYHPLGTLPDWKMDIKDGVMQKIMNPDDKGNPRFFTVEGRKITTSGREVDAYYAPGIVEVPDKNDPDKAVATVGFLIDKETGDVLIQTAAEPFQAEPGEKPELYVVIRASVQGSYSNIKENKVKFSDKIDLSKYTQLVSENPSRGQGKVRIGYTEVDKKDIDLKDAPNYRWFKMSEIDQAITQDKAPFNGYFRNVHSEYKAATSPTPAPQKAA